MIDLASGPINASPNERTLFEKIKDLNWLLLLVLCAIGGLGIAMMYSAGDGDFERWASRHAARFGLALAMLLVVALIDLRFWLRWAYLIYAAAFVLLVAVEVFGSVGMGAQRWINFGFFQLQPSEVMKIALVLALARYFHGLTVEDVGRPLMLLAPLGLTALPTVLVLKQPDLGTAAMMVMGAGAMFFLAGVRWWKFAGVLAIVAAAIPVAGHFLRPYQLERVKTFLDPESDPLGSGYHILQSKIALGSGGLFGKGFMQGSQSHLNFLPEKQTDFVFTMYAEEFGLFGGLILLALYAGIFVYGLAIAVRCRSHFGRLLAMGLSFTFFLYVFINMAMVMGLIPVVGVPLPLMSYGGTAMLTVMGAAGLMISVYVHRDLQIGRHYGGDEDE